LLPPRMEAGVVSNYPEHQFYVERAGPLRKGQGGKAAATRFRAVCECGHTTSWRKFRRALDEDMLSHLRSAEEGGEKVSRAAQMRPPYN
jgi:hypothetical protein